MTDWDGGATRQTTASAAREARLSLVIYHDGGTLVVPLLRNGAVTVGRTDAADVVLAEDSLSRRHARFQWSDEGVWVEDLGSTNGTFINRGRRLLPGDRHPLRDGDEVIVGKTFLRFQVLQ